MLLRETLRTQGGRRLGGAMAEFTWLWKRFVRHMGICSQSGSLAAIAWVDVIRKIAFHCYYARNQNKCWDNASAVFLVGGKMACDGTLTCGTG